MKNLFEKHIDFLKTKARIEVNGRGEQQATQTRRGHAMNVTTYSIVVGRNATITGMSILSVIMQLAHQARRVAAQRYNCSTREIVFGECLRMAWEVRSHIETIEPAQEPTPAPSPVDFRVNEAGFVIFRCRDFSHRGDKGTWARYDANRRQLTICLATYGRISSEYLTELNAFATAHGITDFDDMRSGDRRTVTL